MRNEWPAFAEWMCKTEPERLDEGLPLDDVGYASVVGVTDRTLRNWRRAPEFQELLEKTRARVLGPGSGLGAWSENGVAFSAGDLEDTPEGEYLKIKQMLVSKAMSGDPKYIDLYYKTYGKEFVAEENASRSNDLSSLDLKELIAMSLLELGDEYLIGFLADKGWKVSRG